MVLICNWLKDFAKKKVGMVMRVMEKILEVLTMVILTFMVATILIQVFSRLLGLPIVWTEELTRAFLVYGSLLGGGLAYYKGQGFKITFVVDRLPPKYKKFTEIFILLISTLLIIFTLYTSILYINQIGGSQTSLLNIPKIGILMSFPLGLMLIIIRLIRDFKDAITK